MTVFPLFENIDRKNFLVAGGGSVAARKVERLLAFTTRITVIAPETDIAGVRVLRRAVEDEDLMRADFVIAATDDRALNRHIAAVCREGRIPVNVADDPELCTFIFPAIVKRGDLTVGISTAGASPAYAWQLRREIESILPDHIGGILERMSRLRRTVPERIPDQKKRAVCYREALALLVRTDNGADDEALEAIIRRCMSGPDREELKENR